MRKLTLLLFYTYQECFAFEISVTFTVTLRIYHYKIIFRIKKNMINGYLGDLGDLLGKRTQNVECPNCSL